MFFKSSDIVYIDTFSCFLTLSVFDNLALKKGSKQANIEPKENVTNIYPEMKTDLRLVGIVVNLVKNGNADEKIPIIKC